MVRCFMKVLVSLYVNRELDLLFFSYVTQRKIIYGSKSDVSQRFNAVLCSVHAMECRREFTLRTTADS